MNRIAVATAAAVLAPLALLVGSAAAAGGEDIGTTAEQGVRWSALETGVRWSTAELGVRWS